jgi:hypothetical protein
MLVHVNVDYGHGDLAFAEVVQRLTSHLAHAEPVLTPVSAFSTLVTGFRVAQLGLNEAPTGTLIYDNVAPREDDEEAWPGNAGERLAFARWPTGVRVVGINAGDTCAFVREAAEEIRWAVAPAERIRASCYSVAEEPRVVHHLVPAATMTDVMAPT